MKLVELLGGVLNGAIMAIDHGANGVAKVAQKVPAISDLDRSRCTLTDPVRVGPGLIAGHHFDAGMLAKPTSQRLGLSVWQEIHDPISLQIDKNGPVAMAAPSSPVVHPKNLWNWWRCVGDYGLGGHPQQRVGADWDGMKLPGNFTAPLLGLLGATHLSTQMPWAGAIHPIRLCV